MPHPSRRPQQPLTSRDISRRGFLAAAALTAPAAWVLASGGVAKAASIGGDAASQALGLSWYDITSQTVSAAAFAEPVTASRTWAVSWLAAARAVRPGGDPGFNAAAFPQALHDTLIELVPGQQAALDAALASSLAAVPDGPLKSHGIAAGASAATAVLLDRAGDGLDTASVDIAYTPPPPAPGIFQLTPPLTRAAVRAGQGNAKPFLLVRNDQFDPGPPPSLDSAAYLTDLAEIQATGGTTSPRTAAQTDVALFWYPSVNFAYIPLIRQVLAAAPHQLSWQARFVAAFHVITTDAQISIYNAKYKYLFWRPYTAITTGAVNQDPAWTSLLAAPQHPEYPSGHGGQAGASQAILEAFLGPQAPVTISLTSSNDPGSTRTYTDWATITQEIIDARVWEGVHYRHSDATAASQGAAVAAYGLRNLGSLGI
jgi:hypothetical protein